MPIQSSREAICIIFSSLSPSRKHTITHLARAAFDDDVSVLTERRALLRERERGAGVGRLEVLIVDLISVRLGVRDVSKEKGKQRKRVSASMSIAQGSAVLFPVREGRGFLPEAAALRHGTCWIERFAKRHAIQITTAAKPRAIASRVALPSAPRSSMPCHAPARLAFENDSPWWRRYLCVAGEGNDEVGIASGVQACVWGEEKEGWW